MIKYFLTLAAIIVFTIGRGQSFEGSIRFEVKQEYLDPEFAELIKTSRQILEDTANAELLSKLDDWGYISKLLESDSSKMEHIQMLQSARFAVRTINAVPSAYTVNIRANDFLTHIEGGAMDKSDVLYLADKDSSFMIHHESKTYFAILQSQDINQVFVNLKITKTNKRKKIIGYDCKQYIVEAENQQGIKLKADAWITIEMKKLDSRALAKQVMNNLQTFVFENVNGVPLKMDMITDQIHFQFEATELKEEKLSTSLFEIPQDFIQLKGK